MSRNTLPQILLGAAVLLAIAVGLWQAGGPRTGQMERHDQTRFNDLQQLRQHVRCAARNANNTLPDTLVIPSVCTSTKRLNDPYTDTPYRYVKLSDSDFELCATFERPDRLPPYTGVDIETGCLRATRK